MVHAQYLPVTRAGGEPDQLLDRGLLDRLGDRILEVTAEVAHRLLLDGRHARAVRGLVRVELLRAEEVVDLLVRLQVEPMPIDHRVAAEDEANGLEIGERELVDSFETLGRFVRLDGHLIRRYFIPGPRPGRRGEPRGSALFDPDRGRHRRIRLLRQGHDTLGRARPLRFAGRARASRRRYPASRRAPRGDRGGSPNSRRRRWAQARRGTRGSASWGRFLLREVRLAAYAGGGIHSDGHDVRQDTTPRGDGQTSTESRRVGSSKSDQSQSHGMFQATPPVGPLNHKKKLISNA